MALRAVPDHPKFTELKMILGLTKGACLGYIECIWHFCGRYTPQGNIGKYSDRQIESWCEWDGEPGALIEALVSARWIDADETHRLIVHDWPQHADTMVHADLAKKTLLFVNGAMPNIGHDAFSGQTRVRLKAEYLAKFGDSVGILSGQCRDSVGTESPSSENQRDYVGIKSPKTAISGDQGTGPRNGTMPEPEPEPEPEPAARRAHLLLAPPSIDQVFVVMNMMGGTRKMAEKFVTHYSAAKWIKKNGDAVVDWQDDARAWVVRQSKFNPVSEPPDRPSPPPADSFTTEELAANAARIKREDEEKAAKRAARLRGVA